MLIYAVERRMYKCFSFALLHVLKRLFGAKNVNGCTFGTMKLRLLRQLHENIDKCTLDIATGPLVLTLVDVLEEQGLLTLIGGYTFL